jgi:DsbC/DsbD-like thiol-disulfide interchange protein
MLRLGHGSAPVTATKISTGQLDITTYPSDAAVAPGNRFSLALDISPHPGIHVYAPGASGYRVVTLTIEPQPTVRVSPIPYPASEIYLFRTLNERVPVYQRPFTLRQDLVLEATREAQAVLRGKDALTVTGTLTYQACDDTVCFPPTSVPLSWTLTLRPIVTERPARPQ